jgi:hypothetical protein
MEFIPSNEDKTIKSNSIKPSPTSVASIPGFSNHDGFLDLTIETTEPTMEDQKAKVLSHLQEDCTGKEADRKYKCFGKEFNNFHIIHLINTNDIANLFMLNTTLFTLARITVYSDEPSIREKTKELETIKTQLQASVMSGKKLFDASFKAAHELVVLLAKIYTDPTKQFMLLELTPKIPRTPNILSSSPKYLLINSNDYFGSASRFADSPQIIETNSEKLSKRKNNPYRSRKTGGKRRGKMNTKRKTKRKIRKINKTKKVKMTNRKNSRYIKRK